VGQVFTSQNILVIASAGDTSKKGKKSDGSIKKIKFVDKLNHKN
jgi:hypothetical protein